MWFDCNTRSQCVLRLKWYESAFENEVKFILRLLNFACDRVSSHLFRDGNYWKHQWLFSIAHITRVHIVRRFLSVCGVFVRAGQCWVLQTQWSSWARLKCPRRSSWSTSLPWEKAHTGGVAVVHLFFTPFHLLPSCRKSSSCFASFYLMHALSSVVSRLRGDRYRLFEHNCNTFTNEVAQFMTGRHIPSYITDLPSEVLSTWVLSPSATRVFQSDSLFQHAVVQSRTKFRNLASEPKSERDAGPRRSSHWLDLFLAVTWPVTGRTQALPQIHFAAFKTKTRTDAVC